VLVYQTIIRNRALVEVVETGQEFKKIDPVRFKNTANEIQSDSTIKLVRQIKKPKN
jgi:hypothetical protein